MIDVAARQGDSRGDQEQAIAVLDAGVARYPDAPPIEVFEALLYRAELRGRTGADAAPDLAAVRALLTEHQFGEDAEQALVLPVEADLTAQQHNGWAGWAKTGACSTRMTAPQDDWREVADVRPHRTIANARSSAQNGR
ncbi:MULTISPECIES: hypothetical protein [unclassified Cryobacterium]|uniref:hypothetical protein n=1 Tax=unclassified Cryobacterium TaxID=2649013 RepID=UPI0010692E6C|nr:MULTISPECIES: hypothetical protein [unclassified Cryobacterium]TFC54578.1 hypothetical protein E3O68_09590 [Cryobacterium sp. TMB3-1-2]TFC70840.1 hypothetical protein E3T21_09040 [Cryobacterium sp. TMB3-15]TFC77293.1 hypothetical protein E3T22_06160 [Cryobacterium sp. TMB3-10]TFD45227.1 hypothetical protein E3T58_02785 [Cryobacterium sp. TMB3-12]